MNWMVSSTQHFRLELSTLTIWVHRREDPAEAHLWVARIHDHDPASMGRIVKDDCESPEEAQSVALDEAFRMLHRDLSVIGEMMRAGNTVTGEHVAVVGDPKQRS